MEQNASEAALALWETSNVSWLQERLGISGSSSSKSKIKGTSTTHYVVHMVSRGEFDGIRWSQAQTRQRITGSRNPNL